MKKLRNIAALIVAIGVILFGVTNVQEPADPGGTAAFDPASVAGSNQAPTAKKQPALPDANYTTGSDKAAYREAANRIYNAYQAQQSDMWIEGGGTVQRVLSDDNEGSRHQRFILRLPNDHTILIAHNIDLAQRVPLKQGDPVSFYGEFEWNDRGGVVHWTHHDPSNRKKGGWIKHKGTTYR